jgi:pyruvate dehydrogenase E1 component beta subunit
MREALNEALVLEMQRDDTVTVIGEDVAGAPGRPEFLDCWGGTMQVTKGLIGKYGTRRVIDTPISESAIVGAAVGAAISGLRPVAEIMFISFIGVCLDQIVNQAAIMHFVFGGRISVPVTFRMNIGAGVGAAAQHSDSVYSVLAHYPGLKIAVPSSAADAKGLMVSAIRDDNPVIVCEHKQLYNDKGIVPRGEYTVALGKARYVRRGGDVTIVAIGAMVKVALGAAQMLQREGIESEVIDPRTIVPLDEESILASVGKTGRLFVVDEDHPCCGMGRDIVARVAEKGYYDMKAPPKTITPPATPVPFAPNLESDYLPTADRLYSSVLESF